MLFFGGSFMFGEGVQDEETTPWQVARLTGGRYAPYNFAVHGYGPQQMLALIEHGIVDTIATHPPRYAFYMAIEAHVERAAGLPAWLRSGPKYTLDKNGEARYAGRFSEYDHLNALQARAVRWLSAAEGVIPPMEKSAIGRRVLFRLNRPRRLNKRDFALFREIVARSRDLLRDRYPDLEFHVLIWDEDADFSARLVKHLSERGLTVHRISDMLPDHEALSGPAGAYRISPHDRHPSPLGHERIADYIVRTIIER